MSKQERQIINVQLDKDVYELLKAVAAYDDRPVRQYLRRLITKDVHRAVAAGEVAPLSHPEMLEG